MQPRIRSYFDILAHAKSNQFSQVRRQQTTTNLKTITCTEYQFKLDIVSMQQQHTDTDASDLYIS